MDLPEEADAYASADFSAVNDAFVTRLLDLAKDVVAPRALDLGTGPGDIPLRLSQKRPDWLVAATDISIAMLGHAREALAAIGIDKVQPVCVDAKRLPFPPAFFDVVFSNSILHHINETSVFWMEVRRVAKPGSLIFFRDLARPETDEAAAAIVQQYAGAESQLLQDEYYRSLLAAYSADEVRRQLKEGRLGALEVTMVTDRHLDIFGFLKHAI
jgi:ubiquinone/menaquinone biosynthesis C-methylase UbiE